MKGIRYWLARILRIQPYIVNAEPIDMDVDFRNTSKTTMRIKAACNHCHNNPKDGRVVILTSKQVMVNEIKQKVEQICPEYASRIEVITPRRRTVGRRPTKVIQDLFEAWRK